MILNYIKLYYIKLYYIVLPLFAQSWPSKINKKNRSRLCRWLQFVSKWRPVSAGESLICPCKLLWVWGICWWNSPICSMYGIFTYITGWFVRQMLGFIFQHHGAKKGVWVFLQTSEILGWNRNVLPLQRVHVVHISLPLPFETRFKVAVQSDVDLMWTYRFESKNKPGPVRP